MNHFRGRFNPIDNSPVSRRSLTDYKELHGTRYKASVFGNMSILSSLLNVTNIRISYVQDMHDTFNRIAYKTVSVATLCCLHLKIYSGLLCFTYLHLSYLFLLFILACVLSYLS